MLSRARYLAAFYTLAEPGMTLAARPAVPKPPAPKPLVKRCEGGCGKPVSAHRHRCLACQKLFWQDIASQIAGQDLFDAVLGRCPAELRRETYDGIAPHLSFTPAPFANAPNSVQELIHE